MSFIPDVIGVDKHTATFRYDSFCREEMWLHPADHERIKSYATGEFFNSMPMKVQQLIADAYTRVEHYEGSAEDMEYVMLYYSLAKATYKNGGSNHE